MRVTQRKQSPIGCSVKGGGGRSEAKKLAAPSTRSQARARDNDEAGTHHCSRQFRGRNASFLAILATLAAGILGGCPGPVPTEVDVPNSFVDARADAPFGPVCLDDEALDLDFDKALGINCTTIRTAISLRRTTAARIDVERARTRLRYELRRCCVSRQSLVEMMELHQGQGLPTNLTERRNHQII